MKHTRDARCRAARELSFESPVTQTQSAMERDLCRDRLARAARPARGREGTAKWHAPGGELLRDDSSHLDFRLRCLKLCGVCWNGPGHACRGFFSNCCSKNARFLLADEKNEDFAKEQDCLPMPLSAIFVLQRLKNIYEHVKGRRRTDKRVPCISSARWFQALELLKINPHHHAAAS